MNTFEATNSGSGASGAGASDVGSKEHGGGPVEYINIEKKRRESDILSKTDEDDMNNSLMTPLLSSVGGSDFGGGTMSPPPVVGSTKRGGRGAKGFETNETGETTSRKSKPVNDVTFVESTEEQTSQTTTAGLSSGSDDNGNSNVNVNADIPGGNDAVERAVVLSCGTQEILRINSSSQLLSSSGGGTNSRLGDKSTASVSSPEVKNNNETTTKSGIKRRTTVTTAESTLTVSSDTGRPEKDETTGTNSIGREGGVVEVNAPRKPIVSTNASTGSKAAATNAKSSAMPKFSFGGGFLHLGGNNDLEDTVGNFLRQGSVVAFVVWVLLLLASYYMAPPESFEVLEGPERNANLTVFFILLYTNMSRLLRMAVRDKSFVFVNSGVMVGSLTVQFIALTSISLMIFLPTPVVVDQVTGIRTHLVRWAEWIPLCFLMTFLAESVDMPLSAKGEFVNRNSIQKPILLAWINGAALGLSTSAGALTAFCTTWNAWLTVVGIAWILFCTLFIRLYQRYTRLRQMTPGTTVDEKEAYDRAKYGLKTIAVCTIAWTGLSASWTIIALMAPRADEGSIFSNKSLVLITESFFEALSKIWYFDLLIDLHNVAFDDASRTMRRLEELRNFMSAVWDHSTDILVWGSTTSGKNGGFINGIVSPSFFGDEIGSTYHGSSMSTLLVEVNPTNGEYRCYTINLSEPITRERAMAVRQSSSSRETHRIGNLSTDHTTKNISIIADILCEAYKGGPVERTIMKQLFYPSADCENEVYDDGDSLLTEQPMCVRHCEARINQLGQSSRLIVLRDVSESVKKFEIEKRLVEEKTARRKDGEANRFTRHEVKNGILAAIGLVESIRDTKASSSGSSVWSSGTKSDASTAIVSGGRQRDVDVPEQANATQTDDLSLATEARNVETKAATPSTAVVEVVPTKSRNFERRMSEVSDQGSGFEDSLGELDNTLRDILDSIMDHAMSLDVINEVYDVRRERVAVPDVLSSIRRQANGVGQSRFSMKSGQTPFPVLGLDPRLLRHIYQNALSNACRYGRYGGNVVTAIDYDEEKKIFRMEVINEPGFGHEDLVVLSKEEVNERVFAQRSSLHGGSSDENEFVVANSSGDGAWIVKKCASMLKGDVSLTIEPTRTVFSFWCPARLIARTKQDGTTEGPTFSLPANTWGIVIDDSGIQRKLMDRFLKVAGIEKDRRIILGKDADEIYGFSDTIVNTLRSNPNDHVLVIVDENLEVVDGAMVHTTVSGSKSMEKTLKNLEPEEDTRLLALVRSANDSSEEISMYLSRAHGYLLKEPIDKNGVLGKIRPWWSKRFRSSTVSEGQETGGSSHDDDLSTADGYDPFYDIIATLEVIDALCKVSSVKSLRNRWKSIKEKLQVLKGDLKSTVSSSSTNESLLFVLSEIDLLRLGDFPSNLPEKWGILRSQINAVVEANR